MVRDIFRRYGNGEKINDIVERLNRDGIRTKVGSAFSMNYVSRIIRNEKYIGIVRSKGTVYTDVVPPIVDEKIFRECNRLMDGHKHKQRDCKAEKPYLLSGKLFCGHCGSLMTAETGTSKTGKVHRYYKCFNRKRNASACGKKNYRQKDLEELVFNTTAEYVLKPDVIERIAEIVVERFNAEITKPAALTALESEWKETEKGIKGFLSAIEQGIITKATKDMLLELEARKEELESKIAVEQARQIQPLELATVKAFLNYFAKKRYESGEARNEFFNSFVNKVILYDDRVLIFYNTEPNAPRTINATEPAMTEPLSDRRKQENSFEPSEFKRVSLGGENGIRTHETG